jgi:hypothetical protein
MADLSHKERGNKTEHENAGGDKMLPIYLAMLDGEEDKNKFELLYVTYRKLLQPLNSLSLTRQYSAEGESISKEYKVK